MKLSTGQTIDVEPIDTPALSAQPTAPGQPYTDQAQAGSGGDGKTEGEGGVRGAEIRCNPTSLAATKNSDLPKRVYGKLATETVAKVRYDSKGANCLMLPEVPKKSRGKKSDVLPKKKRALSKQLIARGKG